MTFEDILASNWTDKEKKCYQKNRRKELGIFYLQAGIANDEPEKRIKFILKNLGLPQKTKLGMLKYCKKGNSKGRLLVSLEKALTDLYF